MSEVCSILLLLQDNNERTTGEENLQAIYKVDKAPSDTALRAVLEEMSVEKMGGGNMLRIIHLLVGIQFKIKMWECRNLFIKFCNANVFEVLQLCYTAKKRADVLCTNFCCE